MVGSFALMVSRNFTLVLVYMQLPYPPPLSNLIKECVICVAWGSCAKIRDHPGEASDHEAFATTGPGSRKVEFSEVPGYVSSLTYRSSVGKRAHFMIGPMTWMVSRRRKNTLRTAIFAFVLITIPHSAKGVYIDAFFANFALLA